MTVTDSRNEQDQVKITVPVNQRPIAVISAEVETTSQGETILVLDGSGSCDPDVSAASPYKAEKGIKNWFWRVGCNLEEQDAQTSPSLEGKTLTVPLPVAVLHTMTVILQVNDELDDMNQAVFWKDFR